MTGEDRLPDIAARARAFLAERHSYICEEARREVIREAACLLREFVTAVDEGAAES